MDCGRRKSAPPEGGRGEMAFVVGLRLDVGALDFVQIVGRGLNAPAVGVLRLVVEDDREAVEVRMYLREHAVVKVDDYRRCWFGRGIDGKDIVGRKGLPFACVDVGKSVVLVEVARNHLQGERKVGGEVDLVDDPLLDSRGACRSGARGSLYGTDNALEDVDHVGEAEWRKRPPGSSHRPDRRASAAAQASCAVSARREVLGSIIREVLHDKEDGLDRIHERERRGRAEITDVAQWLPVSFDNAWPHVGGVKVVADVLRCEAQGSGDNRGEVCGFG